MQDRGIPKALREMFLGIRVGQTVSVESLFQDFIQKVPDAASRRSLKRSISFGIKAAYNAGLLQRVDSRSIPEWFRSLQTVSYWQSQLRGSKLKNGKRTFNDTKSQYLRHLWGFEKWLEPRKFDISMLEHDTGNRFVRKKQAKKFKKCGRAA